MPVYAAGSETFFNPYKFSYYRNSALSPVTDTAIAFDTKIYDTGSNYSTGTGLFTAPVAGFYVFKGALFCGGTSVNYFIAALYKNSSLYRYWPGFNNAGANNQSGGSDTLSLSASDSIFLSIHTSATVALNVGATSLCYFLGELSSLT